MSFSNPETSGPIVEWLTSEIQESILTVVGIQKVGRQNVLVCLALIGFLGYGVFNAKIVKVPGKSTRLVNLPKGWSRLDLKYGWAFPCNGHDEEDGEETTPVVVHNPYLLALWRSLRGWTSDMVAGF